MQRDAETAFLTARATAHATARDVDVATHRAHCDCGSRPTWCDRCDVDVESPDTLVFTPGSKFICRDCADELFGEDAFNDRPALAAE